MIVGIDGLRILLMQNIIEVRFRRRKFKEGYNQWRRMLCTTDPKVLKSLPGRMSLLYKDPKGVGLRFVPRQKGLVVAWDIFWSDFRMISLDVYDIVTIIPTNREEDLTKWWVYFNEVLYKMPSQEKLRFMNV